MIYADECFTLIVVDAFADLAAPSGEDGDCSVATYQGYSVDTPIDGPGRLATLLQKVLPDQVRGQAGLELADMPVAVADLIAERTSQRAAAIDGWLLPLRLIKTQDELDQIRENCRLSDIGHVAARAAVAAGTREIDIWNRVECAIQAAVGARVPIGNDCVVGYRQNNVGGWPLDLPVRTGDSVIVDISVVHGGYWSDSCATYIAGAPTPRQRAMHKTASGALALGASLLRPGAVARDIDRTLRRFIEEAGYPVYPHHSGHGVGSAVTRRRALCHTATRCWRRGW
ncbi:MAG: aminopeptidase P family protein [Anaerolineales bacterium]|nr:aminopeptidase P family protein [Anaerolineales bacterium]